MGLWNVHACMPRTCGDAVVVTTAKGLAMGRVGERARERESQRAVPTLILDRAGHAAICASQYLRLCSSALRTACVSRAYRTHALTPAMIGSSTPANAFLLARLGGRAQGFGDRK